MVSYFPVRKQPKLQHKNMKANFERRKIRVRSKVVGLSSRPRLVVSKSNKYVVAQVVDDTKGVTLAMVSTRDLGKIGKLGKKGLELAKEVGLKIAEKLKLQKISKVVFDKSGYKYHGKVKSVAEGAREGGLEF